MLLRVIISTVFILLLIHPSNAQQEAYYFFSNLGDDIDEELQETFRQDTHDETLKKTIISLGDNDIESLIDLKSISHNTKVKFLTGDKDQKDLQKFKKLHKEKEYKYLTDGKYCPDPQVKEIGDQHILISINSNWFLDRHIKFKAKDTDCNSFNQIDFFEELESIVEKNEHKNIIILAHHNTLSNTPLGGKHLWPYEFIPIVGNLYASYRRNIGRQQDLTSKNYGYYADRLNEILENENVSLIAGHDYVNSVYKIGNLFSMNVNSGKKSFSISEDIEHSLYQSTSPSYFKLTFYDDDLHLEIVNAMGRSTIQLRSKTVQQTTANQSITQFQNLTQVQASKKYKSNKFKNWLMGSGYRKAWSTPVEAPLLHLDSLELSPYARGGGLQTQSVKLKSENKRKYAFRALDKEPEKSLNNILQNSVYKKVVQELITTMHPYGPLVAHELIKETDIIHIQPELYIMASNQPKMEEYHDFDNKIGTLEEKPKGQSKKRDGYSGADEVYSTFQMLGKLTTSSKNRIDKMAYAKARVFDMYIGDWDRHEDNWKWAMFKTKEGNIYRPIPKDRDHVFSKWTGVIPTLADFFIANAENFDHTFGNLRQLNFKAYFLDRQLATELSSKDWQEAADYIIDRMSTSVIDQSINAFPEEVKSIYSEEIKEKLKSRKLDLKRAVEVHYCNLAEKVNITGTNKRDYFDITRNDDGSVTVEIYKLNKDGERKKRFFHRTFLPKYTSLIYCYGLDGEDHFDVHGESEESIKIRIIGGNEEDHIIDSSKVEGRTRLTQVYDSYEEDTIEDPTGETKLKRPSRVPYYTPYEQGQNSLLPLPSISKSSGNGWGLNLGVEYIIQGYNKPEYAKYYKLNALFYPQIGAYRLDGSFRYRHFLGKSDFMTKFRVSDEYDKFPFFYGIGSETTFDDEERERGRYRLDYDYFRYDVGLSRSFFLKSDFESTLYTEFHGLDAENRSGIEDEDLPNNTFFFGFANSLSLDFTDQTKYPTDGNKFNATLETRISDDKKVTANILTDISYYKSVDLGILTTFAAKIGYQAALGDVNFYHLSAIGSNVGLRGYTRNRFLDKYAAFYNTEIRFNCGVIQTPLIQFNVGTFLLYDGGKVWNEEIGFNDNDWKNSYGIGFFIAPYSTDYAFSYSIIRSDDFDVYSQFQLGFKF